MSQVNKSAACPLCSSDKYDRLLQISEELSQLTSIMSNNQKLRKMGIKQASGMIDRMQELRNKRQSMLSRL